MAPPPVQEKTSQGLELFLRNLELQKEESSLSVICPNGLPLAEDELTALLGWLEKWFIRQILIMGNTSRDSSLFKISSNTKISRFLLFFEFWPDLKPELNKSEASAAAVLQPYLFCTRDYFKRHQAWGKDIFHFYGATPEIFCISQKRATEKINVPNADDVEAIFLINSSELSSFRFELLRNITTILNRREGLALLQEKVDTTYTLVIFRKAFLFELQFTEYRLNRGNNNLLEQLQKTFRQGYVKSARLDGMIFDLEKFFRPECACPPLLPINTKDQDDQTALISLAMEALAQTTMGMPASLNFRRFLKRKFDNFTLSGFNTIGGEVKYIIDSASSVISLLQTGSDFIICIDEKQFEPGAPYFRESCLQVRRAASRSAAQHSDCVSIALHDLLNTDFSFAEKKFHLDLLILRGANHFVFNIAAQTGIALPHLYQKLRFLDPDAEHYFDWFAYLQQLGHFMKTGIYRPDALVLYPALDDSFDDFYQAIAQLERFGVSYELTDFDLFNDFSFYVADHKQINFNNNYFSLVILPAISVMPLETLQKLANFYTRGGIIVALGGLPERPDNYNEQDNFEKLLREIWPEESSVSGAVFKLHESGGRGYFQPQIPQFNVLLDEVNSVLRLQLLANRSGIMYRLYETNDAFQLFVMNTDQTYSGEFTLRTKLNGRPYRWNFARAELTIFPNWYYEKQQLCLCMNLLPTQSELLIIDKKQSPNVWQLSESELDGCVLLQQDERSIRLEGWQRKEGNFFLTLCNGQKTKKLSYDVLSKLPVLVVSPKAWYLESAIFSGKINLGDLSLALPTESGEFIYHKIIVIKDVYLQGQKLFLDIGEVKYSCAVFINDQFVERRLWPAPAADITGYVLAGENKISIKIHNNLSNRLAKEDGGRMNGFVAESYGLFGPVKIIPYNKLDFSHQT